MREIRVLLVDDTPGELPEFIDALKARCQKRGVNLLMEIVENARDAMATLRRANPYDLLLLDIVGVSYEAILQDVGALYPYLPIVMFSRNMDGDEIVDCIDLGAKSFIFKAGLTIGADKRAPLDEARDEQKWNAAINRMERFAADYQPMKRAMESSPEVGSIEKSGGSNSIIRDQMEFLKSLRAKPSSIANWFPDVRDISEKDGTLSYAMPLYRHRPLRNILFAEDDQKRVEAFASEVLTLTLGFCRDELYMENVSTKVPADFVERIYFERYAKRYERTLKDIATRQRDSGGGLALDTYERLVRATQIKLGGRELRSPDAVLAHIRSDNALLKRLAPRFLCLIHGDLHFENILVDDRLPRKLLVKLIDPRGFEHPGFPRGTGDPAYDIGKLFHSAHGLYDFIHAGYLRPRLDGIRYKGSAGDKSTVDVPGLYFEEWATVPHGGGGSGDVITMHKRAVPKCAQAVFETLDRFIRGFFAHPAFATRDPDWLLRASLHEVLHFCTLGPFHLNEEVRAIALHIRGVELLNDFWDDYKAGRLDPATTT